MRVVHLSHSDLGGGAALSAYRVHTTLRRLGHDSRMLVARRWSDDPTVLRFAPPRDALSRARRWLRRELIRLTFDRPYRARRQPGSPGLSDSRHESGAAVVAQLPPADVVHVHWVARFLDYGAFFGRVPRRTPVVWTLHDMHPFTGGCHYTLGCERFAARCGACPQLGSTREHDLSRRVWRRKGRALAAVPAERVRVVALSPWLGAQARRSSLLARFPVSVIANGVDTERFAPRAKEEARAALGLSATARVVLFVASGLDRPEKGFAALAEALGTVRGEGEVVLLTVGKDRGTLACPVRHVSLGALDARSERVPLAYAAADVLAMTSAQEAFGNVVLEAMASGTPVVGFGIGGVRDTVESGVTGLLVEPGDAGALGRALEAVLAAPAWRAELGRRGREVVLERYTADREARRYLDLYGEILGGEGAGERPGGGP